MKTKILIPRSRNFNRAGAEVTRLPSIVSKKLTAPGRLRNWRSKLSMNLAAAASALHLSASISQSRLTPAAAVRGFKARTPGLLALACLLVAVPATAQVNYAVSGSTAYVTRSPNASGDVVIASTFNGYPVTHID